MKLNLPSTWTSQKITSLFPLIWFSTGKVNAGQAFENCVAYTYSPQDRNTYNLLSSFPWSNNGAINNNQLLTLCCPYTGCSPINLVPSCYGRFYCYKINQLITCRDNGCGSIIGNIPITTNTTLGICSSYDITTVANYLLTIIPNGTSLGYAYWSCPINSPCANLSCDWDNGGWTCSNSDGNCFLQWTASWPGPNSTNPFSTTSSSLVSFSSSPVTSPVNSPIVNSNPLNTPEIIGITVGVGVGTASLTGLTCWYLSRKKQQKRIKNLEVETIDVLELLTRKESDLERKNEQLQKPDEQYQAYMESDPSHRTGDVRLAR